MAFEHKGVCALLCLGRLAKMYSPSRVCRTIKILCARITQIDPVGINDGTGAALWLVVDDCGTFRRATC